MLPRAELSNVLITADPPRRACVGKGAGLAASHAASGRATPPHFVLVLGRAAFCEVICSFAC